MRIPDYIQSAIEAEAAYIPGRDIARAATELSTSYRAGDPTRWRDDIERLAYVITRAPATHAAIAAAFEAVALRAPGFEPRSLLDFGAGPGTAAWAARERFATLVSTTNIERDAGMIAIGRRIATAAPEPISSAVWVQADFDKGEDIGPHDFVVLAYSLGELARGAGARALEAAWRCATQLIVIIEPGTPAGFQTILGAREWLIEHAGQVVAPCPNSLACPMSGGSWCHFAQRLERTRLHRITKGAELGYEDEKFSYVAVSRVPVSGATGRIVSPPKVTKAQAVIEVCAEGRIDRTIIARRDKTNWRAARHARWGDEWPPSAGLVGGGAVE